MHKMNAIPYLGIRVELYHQGPQLVPSNANRKLNGGPVARTFGYLFCRHLPIKRKSPWSDVTVCRASPGTIPGSPRRLLKVIP